MADPTQPQKTELVLVTIAVEHHTHNGIHIPKGGTIEVDKALAEWMRQHNIIEG